MPLQFRRISSDTVREVIAKGVLSELEHSLLKKHGGQKLRWSTADKALFCSMAVDVLEAQQEHMKLEVIVRSFCHASAVTADHLNPEDRFNTRRSILLIGDVGVVPAPWAGLIQPAVYLHDHGFNVICVEVPELATSAPRWLKCGPAIIHETLRFMNVHAVSAVACGNGGAVFLDAIGQHRSAFGPTHFVYNVDCPRGTKKAPFPVFKLEEHLRETSLQFWFGFSDEEGLYNRFEDGTPRKSFEAITGMQARLEGERRRGRRALDYDEVLVTEQLNLGKAQRVSRLAVGRNVLYAFSAELLASLARFLDQSPSQCQTDLNDHGGLVTDMKFLGQMKDGEVLPELPALESLRFSPEENRLLKMDPGESRVYQRRVARRKGRELSRMNSAPSLLSFGDADAPGLSAKELALSGALSRRSSLSRSGSKASLRLSLKPLPSQDYLLSRTLLLCEDDG